MKSKPKMLINVNDDETRVAFAENGQLQDFYIEQTQNQRSVGNIYKGTVVKIQTSFQAAFIEYGNNRHGFLPLSDINPQIVKASGTRKDRPSIQDVLKPGQTLCVQVLKDQIGHKGAALTTNIVIPGRFLVFMPFSERGGVSRKIEDEEQRQRLKTLLHGLVNEEGSIIVRTAGIDRSLSDLKQDFLVLRRKWNRIQAEFEKQEDEGLIYHEADVAVKILRDHYSDHIDEVWTDDPDTFQRAREFFRTYIPKKQNRLHLYVGERTLFSTYGVEEQVDQLNSNQVQLPSGGSIVIDQTEALVAIDVNSGKSSQESNIEDTATRTNVEAAEEIARQLCLRNLGGLIVVDFIDMFHQRNRDMVVKTMQASMQSDRAKWSMGEISQFGLLELSRQRTASALASEIKTTCPTCGGSGHVLSLPSLANSILRRIRELSAQRGIREIHGRHPLELTNYLLNKKREQVNQLEMEFDIKIVLKADLSVDAGNVPEFEVMLEGDTILIPEGQLSFDKNGARNKRGRGRSRRSTGKENNLSKPVSEVIELATDPNAIDSEEVSSETKPARSKKVEPSTTDAKPAEAASSEATEEAVAVQKEKKPSKPRGRHQKTPKPVDVSPAKPAAPLSPEAKRLQDLASIPGPLFESTHSGAPNHDEPWAPPKVSTLIQMYRDAPEGEIIFQSSHVPQEGFKEMSEVIQVDTSPTKVTVEPKTEEDVSEKKPAAKKPAAKKAPAKKPVAKKTTEKNEELSSEETSTVEEVVEPEAKKPATKKASAKKPAAKKAPAKKPAAKKAPAKKPVAKKAPAKKPAAKKAEAEVAAESSAGEETTEATAKKAPAKKPAAKKAPAKKTTTTKQTPKTSEVETQEG